MNQQDRDLLIRLETKLDTVLGDLKEVKGILSSHDTRLREVEIKQADFQSLKDEINRLRSIGNIQDTALALGTVVAAILGVVAMYAK